MPKTSKRGLFVTNYFPKAYEPTGTFHRQQLLLDAARQVASPLDVLLYVDTLMTHYDDSKTHARAVQEEVRRRWNGDFNVTLCPIRPPNKQETIWSKYLLPATGLTRQGGYRRLAGAQQVAALDACVELMPDFVFVQSLMCMMPVLLTRKPLPPVFLNLNDIEHTALYRSVSQPPMWLSKRLEYLQIPAMKAGERKAIKVSAKTLVCSEIDRISLVREFGTSNVEAIPNAVSLPPESPPARGPTLLLLGTYGYDPNRVGAEFFLDEIWPQIKATVPDARLTVAGTGSKVIRHHRNPPDGVVFAGYIEDLDHAYAETRVVICPILSGSGTRVKIMEAASYGRPIVSTTLGAEGIDLHDGDEIRLHDSPRDFAQACIDFLCDYDLACKVGGNARSAVIKRYDRSRIVKRLARTLCGSA